MHDLTKRVAKVVVNLLTIKITGRETGESVEMFISSPVLYQIENFTDNTEIRLDQKKYGRKTPAQI